MIAYHLGCYSLRSGAHPRCNPLKFNGLRLWKSQPVSRVLSWIIIHLDWKSPSSLKQPTRKRRGPRHSFPIWSCSGWGLPCHFCYQKRGALLPHPFTLTSRDQLINNWRSTLCCTGRGLSPPRRYLALCPVEPGLSSSLKSFARFKPAIIQLTARDSTRCVNPGSTIIQLI